MRTCAVLPVKRFDDAKQRLDKTLNAGTRRALAEAMVSDVLHALRRAERIDKVIVVTGENGAEALARALRRRVDPRRRPRPLARGARRRDWALERDYERVLLVPGDCPALDPRELDELVAGAMSAPDVVIVPDRHGTGTNALLIAPARRDRSELRPRQPRAPRAARPTAAGVRLARGRAALARARRRHRRRHRGRCAPRSMRRTGGAAHTRGLLERLVRHPPRHR